MKKVICILLAVLFTVFAFSCEADNGVSSADEKSSAASLTSSYISAEESKSVSEELSEEISEEPSDDMLGKFDKKTEFDNNDTTVVFTNTSVTVNGSGAVANGTTVTIGKEGTYVFSGKCSDGRIVVEIDKTEKAHLVFNGLELTSANSAPVWIQSADKVSVTLAEGTENVLTDAKKYTLINEDEEPNACLFSKDDLTINGTGKLTVNGNFNNGICTKDDLKIVSGTIIVKAKNNGIKGNDSVFINDGTISVECENDGIKVTNDEDADKGYFYMRGGNVTIDCGDDAVQAISSVTVTAGIIDAKSKGDVVNCDGDINVTPGTVK